MRNGPGIPVPFGDVIRLGRGMAAGCALLAALVVASAPVSAASGSTGGSTGGATGVSDGRQYAQQDAPWLAAKNDGRVQRNAAGVPMVLSSAPIAASFPSSDTLSTSIATFVVEPEGDLYDDKHAADSDTNYWNFCGPGASAVTLEYWPNTASNATSYPAQYYTEPSAAALRQTHWWASLDYGTSADTSDGYSTYSRSYIVYLAEQVNPANEWPSSSTGELNWSSLQTPITAVRDALNWEASGHASGWSTYFYAIQGTGSGWSASVLLSDVEQDIYSSGVGVVADVYTSAIVNGTSYHLPNWGSSSHVTHSIAIVGYNNSNATYTYIDTCGVNCTKGTGENGGVHTVPQTTMYELISALGGGIVW